MTNNNYYRNVNVSRPPTGIIDPKKTSLIFQQLELDHYIGSPYTGMPGAQTGQVPIMRVFGVTQRGNSVCCHIHGFTPYFYASLPDMFTEKDCVPFKVCH